MPSMAPGTQLRIKFKGKQVVIEALGFTGTACDLAVGQIAAALGQVTDRENKPEYYKDHEVIHEQAH